MLEAPALKSCVFRHFLILALSLWASSLHAQSPNIHLGDVDDDGVITVRDIALIVEHVKGTVPLDEHHAVLADVTKDGAVNQADVDELIKEVLETRTPENLPLSTVRFTSPASGEGDVSVNRETVVHFTVPLAINATLDTTKFYAEFAGRKVLSRVEISSDRKKASLFYLEPLPANSRVKVTFDGSGLDDLLGRPFDGNGNGLEASALEQRSEEVYHMSFDTHSSSPIPATGITGRVLQAAPEGSATPPAGYPAIGVPGVTITVDGQEQTMRTTTDAQGYFTLAPCPSGVFFVHIDGRTSQWSSYPSGSYFPNVGKKWEAIAGKADNPSGHSEDSQRGIVYLPCVCPGTLQPVSQTQATTVGFPQAVLDANPQLAGTTFTFPANTAFSDDGTRGGSLGPVPVPADRLPSPLPPGLRLPFVFSLQTSGPTNFERPVAVCLPNLPDPLTGYKPVPGEKTALVAFNHDTGQWEVVGPMTVTADGNFMKSDPGVGLRQPGWGGGTPGGTAPGAQGDGGEPIDPPDPDDCGPSDIEVGRQIYALVERGYDCARELNPTRIIRAIDCLVDIIRTVNFIGEKVKAVGDLYQAAVGEPNPNEKVRKLEIAVATIEFIETNLCVTLEDRLQCAKKDGKLSRKLRVAIACVGAVIHTLNEICASTDDCDRWLIVDIACEAINGLAILQSWLESKAALIEGYEDDLIGEIGCAGLASIKATVQAALLAAKNSQGGSSQENANAASTAPGSIDAEVAEFARQRLIAIGARPTMEEAQSQTRKLDATYLNLGLKLSQELRRAGKPSSKPFYYRLQAETFEVRGKVTAPGGLNIIFQPNEFYHYDVFEPVSGLVAHNMGRSSAMGGRFQVPSVILARSEEADTDSDGLPADAESILGTSPTNPDTDGDGVTDGAELKNGSDPMSGLAVSTGVIARAPLTGTCTDITAGRDVLAAACGTEGVYILGVRQGLTPTRLAQITTAPNAASTVAISSNLLAIGLGSTGTLILDISTPDTPQFLRLVKLGSSVRSLAAAEGIVHIGLEDGRVAQVDMITGRLIGSVNLGSAPHDLAVGKGVIYAVVSGSVKTLPVTSSGYGSVGSTAFSGTVPNTTNRFRLFKGSSRLYAAHRTGFSAYNITTPGAPVLLQDNTTAALGWSHLVATGSNLAIATLGANNPDDVSLYDLGTNGAQANFLTTFATPGAAQAATIYNGLAYVADGTAGVQVVNFRAFDTLQQPPTVTLALETASSSAEEGRFLPVIATVTDDVQVRNVEFLVDGQRLDTDGNFPFEARVLTPRLVPGKTSFTVQARATDTGGNAALSNVLTLDLTADTQSPSVLAFTPGNDALLATASGFTARFTEPVAAASLHAGSVFLWAAGPDGNVGTDDDLRQPVSLLPATDGSGTFRDTAAFQTATPLPPGRYRVLLALGITDAKGNPLAAPYSSTFQIISGTDSDGDGIVDNVEATLGLDPQNQDSNANGIPDGLEDYDGDGLRNAWELRYGFDPRLADTNGNGTNDNLEDGDKDTLNALVEQTESGDPTKHDTDGDGWPDQVEVEFFSSLADAKSKPLSLFVGSPAVTTAIIGGGTSIAAPNTTVSIIGGGTTMATPPTSARIGGPPP
ncbi:MAG: Ig-like domain-containing protein [Verrucomicrobiaceae bacterium]|nr:Ig-like domain-containing protein [Verrucomicrobiaceae bacterium]